MSHYYKMYILELQKLILSNAGYFHFLPSVLESYKYFKLQEFETYMKETKLSISLFYYILLLSIFLILVKVYN